MRLAFALVFAVAVFAQGPGPAPLPAPSVVAAPAPVVVEPLPTAIAPSAANQAPTNLCPGEPGQYFSAGAGISGLGPAKTFGYYSMSQHIACGTYTTEITEFVRMPGGTVGTSARAGVSKVLWTVSNLTIGIVGDVGAAEGPTGSANGSLSGRGYALLNLFKSPWSILFTAETLKIAGAQGQQTILSMGFGYSKR